MAITKMADGKIKDDDDGGDEDCGDGVDEGCKRLVLRS